MEKRAETAESKVDEAVDFLRRASENEGQNRNAAIQDMQFRDGDQWPSYASASRGLERPQLTINEIDAYIRQVCNQQRQQRPRIKCQPTNTDTDAKMAKVITGIIRHIQEASDADNAYDIAFDSGATIGWGYWQIFTEYAHEKSFDQNICIGAINNPLSVYFDPNSKLPDGSDAMEAMVTDMISKEAFKREYPDAQVSGFQERGAGDQNTDWQSEHDVRIANYYRIEKEKKKLVKLSDGSYFFEDELPPPELLQQAGVFVIGDRESFKRKVIWRKQTSFEILDERILPGKYIPIVPFYWDRKWIDGREVRKGMVRNAIDPQRMINFWQTAITESLALAPKAKWLMAEGQDEGHEQEFRNANISPIPVLRYKPTDIDGNPAPPPQRLQPEPPPPGMMEAAMGAGENLQRVMGMFDPAARSDNAKSGTALNAERSQSDNSNFHGYDNLTKSMKHTGRIILSWMPSYYDTQRTQRIIGEDGKDKVVQLNQPNAKQQEDGQIVHEVLNDMSVGEYDVVMEIGPGYDTKRQEGVDSIMQLMNTPIGEKIATVGDDLVVRQMDFPTADILADRLAAANPLSQIDEDSDVPPQAQMMIKQLQNNLQQAGQHIQQLETEIKTKMGIIQYEQGEETKREHMRLTVKAHDVERRVETSANDTHTRALTAQNVEEIRGLVTLLAKHLEVKNYEKDVNSMESKI